MILNNNFLAGLVNTIVRDLTNRYPGQSASSILSSTIDRHFQEARREDIDTPQDSPWAVLSIGRADLLTGTPALFDRGEYCSSSILLVALTDSPSLRPAQLTEKGGTGLPQGSRPLVWRLVGRDLGCKRYYNRNEVRGWTGLPSLRMQQASAADNTVFEAPRDTPRPPQYENLTYAQPACTVLEGVLSCPVCGHLEGYCVCVDILCHPEPVPVNPHSVTIGQYADYWPTPPASLRSSAPRTATGAGLVAQQVASGVSCIPGLLSGRSARPIEGNFIAYEHPTHTALDIETIDTDQLGRTT